MTGLCLFIVMITFSGTLLAPTSVTSIVMLMGRQMIKLILIFLLIILLTFLGTKGILWALILISQYQHLSPYYDFDDNDNGESGNICTLINVEGTNDNDDHEDNVC